MNKYLDSIKVHKYTKITTEQTRNIKLDILLFFLVIFSHVLLENEKKKKKNQQQQQSYTFYFPFDNFRFVFSPMFRKSNIVIEKYYIT